MDKAKEKKRNIIFSILDKAKEGWTNLPSHLKDIYGRKKRVDELTESVVKNFYPGGLSDSASNMLIRDKISKQLKEGTFDPKIFRELAEKKKEKKRTGGIPALEAYK